MLLELPWDQWPCAGGLSAVTPFEWNSPDGVFPVPIQHRGEKREERNGTVSKHSLGVENERANAGRDG